MDEIKKWVAEYKLLLIKHRALDEERKRKQKEMDDLRAAIITTEIECRAKWNEIKAYLELEISHDDSDAHDF